MIKDFDHVVLTTADLDQCLDFYTRVLGMRVERFGKGRVALRFGDRKFNVHPPGFDASLKADKPTPGSLDFCFLADKPISEVVEHLKACNVTIIDGPGKRTGARFDLRSVYVRDPDGNLVEISEPYPGGQVVMDDANSKQWQDILAVPREQLNLGEAALVIARDEYPQLDIAAYLGRIDELAATLRKRLHADIAPAGTLPLLNHYMFDELGFAGNTDDYYDPRNSFLNEVIDRKLGIPITLSVLYLEVGRRVGLPLSGVSFPGHFLLKCALRDGTVILDAYAKGALLGIKDLQKRLRVLSGGMEVAPEAVMRMLTTASSAEILARMLRNLKAIHTERGDRDKALTAVNRIIDLYPDAADEYRDRARLLEALECCRAALADYETYLRLDPQADDARAVHGKIVVLRERASRLN